jgi:hypothetical protein
VPVSPGDPPAQNRKGGVTALSVFSDGQCADAY